VSTQAKVAFGIAVIAGIVCLKALPYQHRIEFLVLLIFIIGIAGSFWIFGRSVFRRRQQIGDNAIDAAAAGLRAFRKGKDAISGIGKKIADRAGDPH